MFYPQAMTEIELIVPERDLLAVTKAISGQGIFQQSDGSQLNAAKDSGAGNVWQERTAAFGALERRIQTILQILGADEGLPPKGDLEMDIAQDQVRAEVDRIEQEVRKVSEGIASDTKKIEQLEATLHQLEPVNDLDLDISSLRESRYLWSTLGTMPVANIERMKTSLARIPYIFLTLRQEGQNAVVWLAGTCSNADILDRAARSSYLNALALPESYRGTPTEIIRTVHADIEATQKSIAEQRKALAALRDTYQKRLRELLWDVRASRMLSDAIVHSGKLRYTYVIVGWVPQSRLDLFLSRVKRASKDTLVETYPIKRSAPNPDVPVSLNHNPLLRPFESLVITFARPRYNEIDPTWLIAITFPLLYGAMFGDLGHGLILAGLGGLIMSKRVKALKSFASLGGLITACGLVAAVFGILYGSLFGYENIISAVWMRPLENIMNILIIAIVAGVILLSLGFLLGIYNHIAAKDWGGLIFAHNGIAGLLLYWAFVGLAAGALVKNLPIPSTLFVIVAIVSGIAVTFSDLFQRLVAGIRPLVEESIGTYAIQLFFELFETVIGYLSNTLSYIRVGAFAVAHGGLSLAFFNLASLAGPKFSVGYWIVVLIGQIFIIGFEGLIVGIQTMRLSYYEFFSKFFTGGGRTYEPLTLYPAKEE
ncbi:MAG TPA: V-type ATPase 116kDa subunit family protein [Anaerolineaceae bacterium]|jgi:V/A-type H+-transporting ATPase subunit I